MVVLQVLNGGRHGWWLALGHLVTGLPLCLTVIGTPLGIASLKIIPISLVPLGTRVVRTR